MQADLARRDDRDKLIARAEEFEVDLLINNAGLGPYGPVLENDADDFALNEHLLKGDPRIMIAQFAELCDVDVIVMGTVDRTGVPGLLMGNTPRASCARLAARY